VVEVANARNELAGGLKPSLEPLGDGGVVGNGDDLAANPPFRSGELPFRSGELF
jgi:hypothetical protein